MKAPTITAVRKAHDYYASEKAKWGEDNQATMRALTTYWTLRNAYESNGKTYQR